MDSAFNSNLLFSGGSSNCLLLPRCVLLLPAFPAAVSPCMATEEAAAIHAVHSHCSQKGSGNESPELPCGMQVSRKQDHPWPHTNTALMSRRKKVMGNIWVCWVLFSTNPDSWTAASKQKNIWMIISISAFQKFLLWLKCRNCFIIKKTPKNPSGLNARPQKHFNSLVLI